MNGTKLVVCAVCACSFTFSVMKERICSALPWSAVMNTSPPTFVVWLTIRPRHLSTVSTALTAASKLPVCPTMSALAKLQMITS